MLVLPCLSLRLPPPPPMGSETLQNGHFGTTQKKCPPWQPITLIPWYPFLILILELFAPSYFGNLMVRGAQKTLDHLSFFQAPCNLQRHRPPHLLPQPCSRRQRNSCLTFTRSLKSRGHASSNRQSQPVAQRFPTNSVRAGVPTILQASWIKFIFSGGGHKFIIFICM